VITLPGVELPDKETVPPVGADTGAEGVVWLTVFVAVPPALIAVTVVL
jgi:hypothetical protein